MSIDLEQQTCTMHCYHLSNYKTHGKTRKHTAINKKDKKDVPKSLLYHSHYVPKTTCTEMDIFMYRSIPNKNLCTEVVCTEIVMYRSPKTPYAPYATQPSRPRPRPRTSLKGNGEQDYNQTAEHSPAMTIMFR